MRGPSEIFYIELVIGKVFPTDFFAIILKIFSNIVGISPLTHNFIFCVCEKYLKLGLPSPDTMDFHLGL